MTYTYSTDYTVTFDKQANKWRIDYTYGRTVISAYCKTFGTAQAVMRTIAPLSAWKAA